MNEGRAGDECYEMKFHSSLFTLFKLGTAQRQQENELHNTFPVCVSLRCSSLADVHFFESGRLNLAVIKTASFIELEWSLYEINGEQGPVWDV